MAIFNPLTQIKSLFQLPGALKQKQEAEAQQRAVEARLASATAEPKLTLPAPVQPQFPQTQTQVPQLNVPTNEDLRAQIESLKSSIASFQQPTQPVPLTSDDLRTQIAALEAKIASQQQAPQLPQAQPQEDRLAAIEKALLEAQAKTPEEEQAEKALANLIASKELGLRHIEEQPIEMEAIIGQSAALERRAATQAIPLQTQLAQIQARRQAATDVAKTKFEFEKERKAEARSERELKVKERPEKAEKAFELSPGQARYDYDPITGKYKEIARLEKPEEYKSTEYREISGGLYHIPTKKWIVAPKAKATPQSQINAETYDTAKLEAAQLFETDRQRNQDKKVNANLYYQMRQKVPVSYRDDFDRAFQHLLSKESKARFGIAPKKEEIENPFD